MNGTISGTADVLATHPLWTIKTLSQNQLNSMQIIKLVLKNPLLLYNGVAANALTMLPLTTVRVVLSSIFEKNLGVDNPYASLFTSFSAGGISSIFGSPTELARTIKLKTAVFTKSDLTANHEAVNTYKILKDVYRTEGIKQLFNGYGAVAIRDGIYTAAFFSAAPMLKKNFEPYFQNPIAHMLVSYSTFKT